MNRKWLVWGVAALFLLALFNKAGSWMRLSAAGVTFTVNSTADEPDANPGDGVCETAPGNGVCTLRAAVMEANELPGHDTILLTAAEYTLTRSGAGDANGSLKLRSEITLQGAGQAVTVINGNGGVINDRVVQISNAAQVIISDLSITGGLSTADGAGIAIEAGANATLESVAVHLNTASGFFARGGGIRNNGDLTIIDSEIANNSVISDGPGDGGGILNDDDATLTLINSVIVDNQANSGGGIENRGGASLLRSVVAQNQAVQGGGGIRTGHEMIIRQSAIHNNNARNGGALFNSNGNLTLINTTLSNNQALNDGGGLHNLGNAGLYNVTVAANTADANGDGNGNGGGIRIAGGVVATRNSIIADNADGTPLLPPGGVRHHDCSGTLTSEGFNLVENTNGCNLTGTFTGNITGVDPNLGPLQNNGGPTPTRALLADSPAIDAGALTGCRDGGGVLLLADQRGFVRPVDGNGNGFTRCDMGAYEFGSPGPPAPTATPSPTATATSTPLPGVTPTATATPGVTATPTATPPPAGATIVVNTTADVISGSGSCSLRAAVIAANSNAPVDGCPAGSATGQDTIILPAGVYTLTRAGDEEDFASTGDLDIREPLAIIGDGAATTIIDGNELDRVFHVFESVAAHISQVSVINGRTTGSFGGTAVLNTGQLTLERVILRDGVAEEGIGGAVLNINGSVTLLESDVRNHSALAGGGLVNINGHIRVERSVIRQNITEAAGGGIFNAGSMLEPSVVIIVDSLISGNHGFSGGGVVNDAEDEMIIVNSTISGNSAVNNGGGIANSGNLHLHNVTVTNNRADANGNDFGLGGGLFNEVEGVAILVNSLIAHNQLSTLGARPGEDCAGVLQSGGYNLIHNTDSCTLTGVLTGNVTGQAALLGILQGNGGPTATHSLLAGSPAIDGGDPAGCRDHLGLALATDQRGFARPADGDNSGAAVCDIGAFEAGATAAAFPLYLPLILR